MVNQMTVFLTIVISFLASVAFAQEIHTCSQSWNIDGGKDSKGTALQKCQDLQAQRTCSVCEPGYYLDRAGKVKTITKYTRKSASSIEVAIQGDGTYVVESRLVILSKCGGC